MRFPIALLSAVCLVFLSGCSEEPKKAAKKEEKPLEPITGQRAFYNMYPSARSWAVDSQPLECSSIQLTQMKAPKGKAAAWQCIFVSPSRGKQRPFTWSAVEAEGNLHKGVFAGLEEPYTENRQKKLFVVAALKSDTEEAWKEAEKKSEEYIKKHPDAPVNFLLEYTPRFPDLTWRVFWGESVGTSDYSIFVDATTGQFLERAH